MGSSRRVLAALVIVALPAGVTAQGLGDASKKEQARRKAEPAVKATTYTDADVKGLAPAASAASAPAGPGAGAAAAPETAAAEAGSTGDEGLRQQDEQRWRSRLARANARLAAAREAHDTLASLTLVPGYGYQDENGRTVIGSVEQLQAMTARAKAAFDAAQKAVDDLLEEARRANVPPGWLR